MENINVNGLFKKVATGDLFWTLNFLNSEGSEELLNKKDERLGLTIMDVALIRMRRLYEISRITGKETSEREKREFNYMVKIVNLLRSHGAVSSNN